MSTCTSRATFAFALLVVLAACAKRGNPEVEWARAALQRNPNIELVATDEHNGTFTVRDKRTGQVQAVSLNDLGAAPVSALVAPTVSSTAANTATPASPPASPPPPEIAADASTQAASAEPQKEPVVREEPMEPEAQTAAANPTSTTQSKPYTIERTDAGQLKISGPGISVVSAGNASSGAEDAQASAASDPIICEGRRMLHFDGRTLRVEGDAITVRGGCELYITNSNIVASGTGVVVHDGIVHIANSYVEGANGSFAADSQAKVFVRGSTFQGLSRRDQLAMIQDQGGNRWR